MNLKKLKLKLKNKKKYLIKNNNSPYIQFFNLYLLLYV